MIKLFNPATKTWSDFGGELQDLLDMAKAQPRCPDLGGRGDNIFFYDNKIWKNEVIRSRTGKDGIIGEEFHVYRGRCGDFGIAYDPQKVAELRKIWESREIQLLNDGQK